MRHRESDIYFLFRLSTKQAQAEREGKNLAVDPRNRYEFSCSPFALRQKSIYTLSGNATFLLDLNFAAFENRVNVC